MWVASAHGRHGAGVGTRVSGLGVGVVIAVRQITRGLTRGRPMNPFFTRDTRGRSTARLWKYRVTGVLFGIYCIPRYRDYSSAKIGFESIFKIERCQNDLTNGAVIWYFHYHCVLFELAEQS